MSTCPLVLVEWLDSARPVAEWQWLADIGEGSVVRCASVGWLLHDGDEVKTLAPNMGDIDDTAQVSGVIRIPACSVVRVQRLEEIER